MGKKPGKQIKGLKPGDFIYPVRWKVDQDYVEKLSEKEKEWLGKFNKEFADGRFTHEPLHKTEGERRKLWNDKYAARKDALNWRDVGRRKKPDGES